MAVILGNEVVRYLELNLKQWVYESSSIKRNFEFKTFMDALSFINTVALEVKKVNHHPDWSNSYNKVSISLTTHSAGGVTQLDLDLAKTIDSVSQKFI